MRDSVYGLRKKPFSFICECPVQHVVAEPLYLPSLDATSSQ